MSGDRRNIAQTSCQENDCVGVYSGATVSKICTCIECC